MDVELLIRAQRVVTGGELVSAAVAVRDGRITGVLPYDAAATAAQVVELAADEVLLPGLVDTHVHVNEPGRTEWEGFASATRAAAAGGVTTIVDMPLNSVPPTVDVPALEVKRRAAAGQAYVDVGFWGGVVPSNLGRLDALYRAGVFGFKCFLLDSGVPEFAPLDGEQLRAALAETAGLGALLIVHAEDAGALDVAPPPAGRGYASFLHSRPRRAEELAVAEVIDAVRQAGGRAHIVHLSDADSAPLLAQAQSEGLAISAETCPHYLALVAEEVPDGATAFKCCPPIREAENRERLWAALAAGTVRTIVTDHSPCPAELKRLDVGDFGAAWGGIAGLQLGLPVVWTEARRRGVGLADVVRWMAENTADQVGLSDRGRIAVGASADFAVFAPDEEFTVDARRLHHRHPVSPYDGRALRGVVRRTWLHGAPIDLRADPRGRLVTRGSP